MNILMLGTDVSGFCGVQGVGNTTDRMMRYLDALSDYEPQSTITRLIYTTKNVRAVCPSDGLCFVPVRVPKIQFFPIAGLVVAKRVLRDHPPDLITAQNAFEVGLLGVLLQEMVNAPLEIQLHLDISSPYWLRERLVWNQIRIAIARRVLARADLVRVVSTPIKTFLVERWGIPPAKISVIPVPVFISQGAKNDGSPVHGFFSDLTPLVLFVGRLCYPKNLPAILRIVEAVQEKMPETSFVILGDGPLRSWLEGEIRRRGLMRCHVLGNRPYEELPAWYRRADVTILPSLYEGFGRVLLESYLQKTPAVATRCGGPEDIIVEGETGFLTAVEEIECFTERVLWLLDHPEQTRQMGEKGYNRVKRLFDPDVLVDKMVEQWVSLKA